MNVCQALIDKLEDRTTDLEGYVSEFKRGEREMESYIDTLFKTTDANEFTNELNRITSNTFGAGSNLSNELTNYTGSCLDGIRDGLLRNLRDITTYTADELSLDAYEELLAKAFQKFRGFMNGLGVPNIMNIINNLLGCLTDSGIGECTQPLTDINDRIDYALNAMYMDTNGNWQESNFLSGLNGMTSGLKTNLEAFTTKMDSVTAEIQTNINAGISSLSNSDDILETQKEKV